MRSFDSRNLDFNSAETNIDAWQAEVSYKFLEKYSAQFGYQETNDAVSLELAEKRYIAGLTWEINDYMNLNLEHRIDADYETAVGGTSNSDRITTLEWEAVFF